MASPKKGRKVKGPKYLFKDPYKLQQAVDLYFDECKEQNRPPTVTGLALSLRASRDWLWNWENETRGERMPEKKRKAIADIIKLAKERIHNYLEEQLIMGRQPIGIIFSLKNNFGWKDKTEQAIEGGLQVSWDDKR